MRAEPARFVRRGIVLAVVALGLLVAYVPAEPAPAPTDLVLALDVSASMQHNDPNREVSAAATALVERLGANDAAGLVVFGANATASRSLAPLAANGNRDALLREVGALQYRERYTDLAAGVERALYELRSNGRPGARLVVVFMTDGIMDTGSASRDADRTAWLTRDLLEDARRLGVRIYAVAFSEQADYMLMRQMAVATGGEYYRATKAGEIAKVFETISAHLDREPATAPAGDATTPAAAAPTPAPAPMLPVAPVWIVTGIGAIGAIGLTLVLVAMRRRARPVAIEATDRPAPTAPTAVLLDLRTGARIPVAGPALTIGRDGLNDVVLASEMISAHHARIECRDRRFVVVDLESTNGTFVNGQRITEPTALKDGDRIDFDECRYQFVGGGASASATVARNTSVEQTQVRGTPIKPVVAARGTAPQSHHHEVIEARAGTHKLVSCFVHRDQRAIERCARCGNAGCAECLTITDAGPICRNCAAAPRAPG
jgi:hypothetical protein